MPDSNYKKQWDKDNVLFVSFKLFKATGKRENDQEIIDFLSDKVKATVIKTALREYIANHKD